MNFRRRGVSTVALVAVVSLGVASCSSGSESAKLRFVPSGGMNNEAASDAKMVWGNVSYEIEGSLPEMPTEMASYEIKKQSAPLNEFEQIAAAFGVEGKAVSDPDAAGEFEPMFESYQIGSDDASDNVFEEPTMWLYGDGRLWTWSYYPGNDIAVSDSVTSSDGSLGTESGSGEGSDPVGSDIAVEPCDPDDTECLERERVISEPPTPPENIPSQSEVEALTTNLLNDIGVNVDDVRIQAFADEWSAWSQAQLMLDDIASPISWYFSFGENSVMSSASGMILDIEKGDTYELADAATAVTRLGDYRYYGGYGVADARSASMESIAIDPEEEVTIAITSVAMSYAWMFEENGNQDLMPAFTYSSDDGEVGTVVALSDDLFDFEELPDTTDGDEPTPEPAPPMDAPIPAEEANTLIGLTEDEAMVVAKNEGWEFRIAARDGEQYMLTTDYVTNRVNVTIVEGAVTEVTVG